MDTKWSWREGFRFAFAAKFVSREGVPYAYPKGKLEAFGTAILRHLYMLIDWLSRHLQRFHVILLVTAVAAVTALFIFYNIPAFLFLGKLFPPQWIRFFFFIYCECLLAAAGCRAFGRFQNQKLVNEWKSGKLIAAFPGDRTQHTDY